VFNLLPNIGPLNPVYFGGAVRQLSGAGALALFTVSKIVAATSPDRARVLP